MSLRLQVFCSLLGLIILTGCGQTETVTGTVTLDGQPLPDAEVEFAPVEGGRPAYGTTGADGSFELQYLRDEAGAIAGRYNVTVSTATTKTDENGRDVDVPEKVPEKYLKEGAIVKEVVAGSNHFDIELTSDGG